MRDDGTLKWRRSKPATVRSSRVMAFLLKSLLPFAICLTLGFGSIQVTRFAESKVGIVDPSIIQNRCPGGKDWDLPGSSCRDGIIFDYIPPIVPAQSIDVV